MTKRLIAILMMITMLFTACSQTPETQEDAASEQNTDIYDLLDNDTANTPHTNAGGDSESVESQPDHETENGETPSEKTDTSDETPTEEVEPSNEQPTQSENNNEPTSTEATVPSETEPTVREVAPEQLAALTLFALSMEYPDFMLQGFYAVKTGGEGIYAMFESGGSSLTAHIYPIAGERTAAGTMDIYANEIGFAAFDLVEGADDHYDEISEDKYAPILSELSGVSVFSH